MELLGNKLENKEIATEVLNRSEAFISLLLKNINLAIRIDCNYEEELPNSDYYLIYNRFITIGKKKIDKRIVRKVSKEIMDKEIDDIYFGNVGLAMAQQNHNDLYTKLFRN